MYKVALDTSALDPKFKSHASRGIGRYVRELKAYFDANSHPTFSIEHFDHREFKEGGIINRMIEMLPAGRQTIRQQLVYPLHLAFPKSRFDVLHFPAHMDAPAWSINNYILTVLDLIPLVLSDLYKAHTPNWRFHFARWLEIRAIKNASLILAISENTARDVERILKVPPERIVVTPLGVSSEFFREVSPAEQDKLRAKYKIDASRKVVISVGGIDPRKNYRSLVETFARLVGIHRDRNLPEPLLLIVGNIEGDREYPRLRDLIHRLDVDDQVIETGFVSNEDLIGLYSLSAALFFPSLYEGFGLTPLEAMAVGTPVLTSNTSCLPEVLGDAGMASDAADYEECAKLLYSILHEPGLAQRLNRQGKKRAALYDWSRTGALTVRAYEQLLIKGYGKKVTQQG